MAACKYCLQGGQNSSDPFCGDGCRQAYINNGGKSVGDIKQEEEVRRWKESQRNK